jgi:outer membrane murein-binding lipoprotein Lpp
MTKLIVNATLVAALLLSAGCLFSKKKTSAKESTAISSDVEAIFHQRWVDKRTAELTAAGTPAAAARTQAEQEFRERYQFDQRPKK